MKARVLFLVIVVGNDILCILVSGNFVGKINTLFLLYCISFSLRVIYYSVTY